MNYLMLAIFSAGVVVPIIFILYLFISLIIRGNSQVLLCMECDQCVKVCPIVKKYPNAASPKEIMEAIKIGDLMKLNEAGMILCNSCGACEKACPRGLAPDKELAKFKSSYLISHLTYISFFHGHSFGRGRCHNN